MSARLPRPVLALAVSAIALGAMEGLARLVPEPEEAIVGIPLAPHPTRIWTTKASAPDAQVAAPYTLGPDGSRISTWEAPENAPLLLTLGDSSIFGDGVGDRETLHSLVGPALAARGIIARTGTLAVPGYSTAQTAVALEEEGWDQEPAMLVIGSLWSDCNLDSWRDADLLHAIRSPAARLERALSGLALFRLLRAQLNGALGRPGRWKVSWPMPGNSGLRRVPLVDYAANLNGMLDGARERGAGALLLTLTDDEALQSGQLSVGCAPYVQVQQAMAEARGTPAVSALAIMRSSGLDPRTLLQDPVHPTAVGMQLLAEGVVDALQGAGWPGSPVVPGPAVALPLPEDPFDQRLPASPGSMQRHMFSH